MGNAMTNKSRTLIPTQKARERHPSGRSAFYNDIGLGRFPAPIKVGRRSYWIEEEIDAWLEERIATRNAKQELRVAENNAKRKRQHAKGGQDA
ncbi:MAG: AlpA family phage regulatory protein [Propionivibrio sp.]|nr:AlpA family phage regulatory protein [Propionivibrio sp.]